MEAYRTAFDLATKELQGIVSKFEQLRTRKELLEKTVEALGPLVEHLEKEAATAPEAADRSLLTPQERFDLAVAKAAKTGIISKELAPSQTFIRNNDTYIAEPQS
jgi:hypothetical protein